MWRLPIMIMVRGAQKRTMIKRVAEIRTMRPETDITIRLSRPHKILNVLLPCDSV